MSILNKTAPPKLDANEALSQAIEWGHKRLEDPMGPPASGSDWALISIAASLVEISRKLK